MKDPKRLYFTWQDDEETGGWYSQFDTLEEAAGSGDGKPVEVFTAKLRSIGKYKMRRAPYRIKARKKK